MRNQSRVWLAFILAGSGLASRLGAQATGVPVRSGGVGQGITVGIDYGAGRINRSAPDPDDKIRAVAGTFSLGLGPLGLSGTLGRAWIDPGSGPDRDLTTAGIHAEFVTLGAPLVPFRLLWEAGYSRQLDGAGPRPWRGTVGLGASLTIPTVVLSIKPWLGPRLEYRGNQSGGSQLKAALSAGIDVGLLNGLGLRLGYDSRLGWDQAAEPATGVSIGVSYHFR